jgi:hypothetical protein
MRILKATGSGLTRGSILAVLLSGVTCGCLGPADGVLVLEGTVVDSDGKLVEHCKLALCSDGQTISSYRVEARFRADFVVSPWKEEKYYVELTCPGYSAPYRSHAFLSTGRSDAPPVQLGEIQLPRVDLKN